MSEWLRAVKVTRESGGHHVSAITRDKREVQYILGEVTVPHEGEGPLFLHRNEMDAVSFWGPPWLCKTLKFWVAEYLPSTRTIQDNYFVCVDNVILAEAVRITEEITDANGE